MNHHLLRDLTEGGLWNEDVKNGIIAHNGSIQVRCRLIRFILLYAVLNLRLLKIRKLMEYQTM